MPDGNSVEAYITCGFSGGKVKEIFTANMARIGSDMNATVQDICVLMSLLMQHGYSPDMICQRLGGQLSVVGSIAAIAAHIDESATAGERGL